MIYIFGEWHDNITDCLKFETGANTILIEDYLYDLMRKTDVFLDIYIEIFSYKNGEYGPYGLYVPGRTEELFKKFRKCIQYNTRWDTSCQLARVHYFDIRANDIDHITVQIEENKINILWFKKQLDYIILNHKDDAVIHLKYLLIFYPKIIILLTQLVEDNKEKLCEFMKKQLEENPYIKKELDKINNKKLKPFILNFFGKLVCKELLEIIPNIKVHILKIINYQKNSDDVLLDSMNTITNYLGTTLIHFADVYLIARVFKDFDMKKKKDKSYFDQPNRAHNIIIYCGNSHANNYRDFLSSMGFHDIDHTGNLREKPQKRIFNTPKNCVDMRKIKQPFFSYSNLPTTPKIIPKMK
jgi:hypothetical protein